MNNEKKIKLQEKIIHELQEENISLTKRVNELEKIVDENENIISLAEYYKGEEEKCLSELIDARDKYLQATYELNEQKMKYKKDMEALFKTLQKNI